MWVTLLTYSTLQIPENSSICHALVSELESCFGVGFLQRFDL